MIGTFYPSDPNQNVLSRRPIPPPGSCVLILNGVILYLNSNATPLSINCSSSSFCTLNLNGTDLYLNSIVTPLSIEC